MEFIADKSGGRSINLGSLVITPYECYYIGIPVGKLDVEGHVIYCISAISPIGKSLMRKKQKDTVLFNNRKIEINLIV